MAVLGLAWGLGILDRVGAEGISCARTLRLLFSDIQLKLPVHMPRAANGTLSLSSVLFPMLTHPVHTRWLPTLLPGTC